LPLLKLIATGGGVSGIERILDGEKLSVKTRLRSHEILICVPNALTIEIVNETGKDINIGPTEEPFAGLERVSSIPSSVAVKNGEKSEITGEFVVDSSATVFKSHNVASDVIRSVVTVGGYSLELSTGGKIRPAVTINSQDMYTLAPRGWCLPNCFQSPAHPFHKVLLFFFKIGFNHM
jgi:hypothetical protein